MAKTEQEFMDWAGITLADLVMPDTRDETFRKTIDKLRATWTSVKAKPEGDTAVKTVPAYEQAWLADEEAKAEAHKIAVSMLTAIMRVEAKPAVVLHLRNEIKSLVVAYAQNEYAWHTQQEEAKAPKPLSTSDKAEQQAYYTAGKALITYMYGAQGKNGPKLPAEYLTTDKSGDLTPKLNDLKGNYGGNGSAGMNARCYQLRYSVNGTDLGSDPRKAIRAIWTGADRVGKTTTDLSKLLDAEAPNANASDEPTTFMVGKRKVTVSRLAKGETPDAEPDEDSDETETE